ncbi:MAG TPA: winged helix-turn-helix domain-containing protein [Blastocatellia bacterium]|nr:winged helix-turn-helix domain-containing protein [Blastocatellia bacterium]
MQPVSKENESTYQFDAFELDPVRRVLSRGGKAIALKPKVFETLLVLVRNSGRVMDKDELMRQVWPDTVVEEVNLAHNVSVLRKALGQKSEENRFIITVPGRGYGFVAEVTETQRSAPAAASLAEYELTRSRLVVEDETDERDLPVTSQIYADDTRPLPAKQAKFPRVLGRMRFVFAAVLVCLVIGVALLINSARPPQPPPFAQIKSIAVLPFKPLVAESRDESLEMGMADTLIARLSNIRDINVRPVSAVRKYAGMEQDAVAAGREQRVDAVIDGQIQRSGEKIRVTVRMVRAADGAAMWTNQFDENMKDIFRVQDSISERVAGLLAVKLTGEERERLAKSHTDNTDAYQLYLMGRYHVNRMTDDGLLKSLEYFQQAIGKDPNFALAHAGMAGAYNALGGFNVRPPKEVYPKARSAVLTALNLDPLLVQAHTELAMLNLTFDWDWAASEREFKRAIEINPSDSDAHYFYSFYLAFMGQFDNAIAESRKAQELDPVSLVKLTGLAQVLLIARRYDESLEKCEKALEMDPNLGFAHWLLGLAYMYKASYEPAILAMQKSIPLSGDSPDEAAALAHAYALSGNRTEARKILEELKQQAKRRYTSPGTLADLYGLLGDKDQAFSLLEKAYDERDNMVVLLKVDPYFDPLRSDPRFATLLRRVGFPE